MPKATISLLSISVFFFSVSIRFFFFLYISFCFFSLSSFYFFFFSICLFIYTFIVYLMQHVTSFHINSVNISNNMSDLLWIVHVSRFVFFFVLFVRKWSTGHTHAHCYQLNSQTIAKLPTLELESLQSQSQSQSVRSTCVYLVSIVYIAFFFSSLVPLSGINCCFWMTLWDQLGGKSTRSNSHETVLIILHFTNWHGSEVCVVWFWVVITV